MTATRTRSCRCIATSTGCSTKSFATSTRPRSSGERRRATVRGRAWKSRKPTRKSGDLAEVPGLEENDIEVLLEDGVLTLRGEKKSETEDKDRQFSERYYGRFERRLVLGGEVDEDKVAATFKNGVSR